MNESKIEMVISTVIKPVFVLCFGHLFCPGSMWCVLMMTCDGCYPLCDINIVLSSTTLLKYSNSVDCIDECIRDSFSYDWSRNSISVFTFNSTYDLFLITLLYHHRSPRRRLHRCCCGVRHRPGHLSRYVHIPTLSSDWYYYSCCVFIVYVRIVLCCQI